MRYYPIPLRRADRSFCSTSRWGRAAILFGLLALGSLACTKASYAPPVDGGARDGKADGGPGGAGGAGGNPACSSDANTASRGLGEDCTCPSQCGLGFCVDGVCCSSECSGGCQSCKLPSSLGTCSSVPAGVKPRNPSFCAASTPATCGLDGTCDGKGGCRKFGADYICNAGACNGDNTAGQFGCDGKGACTVAVQNQSCYPYSCDPSTDLCAADCSSNAECAAGQECSQESCGLKINGYQCKIDGDCLSGHCSKEGNSSEGVCCNLACDGPCISCDQAGSVGRCQLVPADVQVDGCLAQSKDTCGTTGTCDGAGSCALWNDGTACRLANCANATTLDPAGICDGKGGCQIPAPISCTPNLCSGEACTQSCKTDADCAPNSACNNGSCGRKPIGQQCSGSSDCQSGQCVDGVCCESSCPGACRSCGLLGSLGRCVDVPANKSDPRGVCVDQKPASCGTDGLCDGSGSCQTYSPGTVCADQTCVAGAYTPPSTCNQVGQCIAAPSFTCSPYVCNGSACYESCTDNSQCVAGNFCENASCGLKPPGAKCSGDKECDTGHCAQGVCCNSACTGACSACNLTSTLGLCVAVPDSSPDPQGVCKKATDTCGTTGLCKGGQCAYADSGTNCGNAVCASASSEAKAPLCDGAGKCVTQANQDCAPFICANGACKTSCGSNADCVAPNSCAPAPYSFCGLKPNGIGCGSGAECLSGFCTEGVCCNSACSDASSGGLCSSCQVSGKVGTCSPVSQGLADPKQRCAKSDLTKGDCSNDGKCNGQGACEPWSTSIGCRQQGCSSATFTPAANCDGAGHCPTATTQKCDPYQCSSTSPSCLTTCTSDSDCTGALTCLKTTNQCGDKLANGKQCKANSDCDSGFCTAEGVCCNSACTGACQSCLVTGNVGACGNISLGGTPRDTTTCAKTTNVCDNTSKCDGKGGCQQAGTGTVCGNASCATPPLSKIPAPTCDGSGTCQPGSSASCGPYQCDSSSGQCKSQCSSSTSDCNTSAGYTCVSGACQIVGVGTGTGTGTGTVTGSGTGTVTVAGIVTGTVAGSATGTGSGTGSGTVTQTATQTGTTTHTATSTATSTATTTGTVTGTTTETLTGTATGTVTRTTTETLTGTMNGTVTETITVTAVVTSTQTPTGTSTVTVTVTSTPTETSTVTISGTDTGTITLTVTDTNTASVTSTATVTAIGTITTSSTETTTSTSTETTTSTNTATTTSTDTATATSTGTATATSTGSVTTTSTGTVTATSTGSVTTSSTGTVTATSTGTVTNTPTDTVTTTSTDPVTNTRTITVTGTGTVTGTVTGT